MNSLFREYLECLDEYNVKVRRYKEAMLSPNGTAHRVALADMNFAADELKIAFDEYVRDLMSEGVYV